MKALAHLEPSGRELNEAARRFAEKNPDAPAGLHADPELYGELARTALLWTRDLLTAVEAAARERPATVPVFDYLAERIDAYFATPERWPKVPGLTSPLLLLVPAYFALRAVDRLDYHVQRPLLAVDYDEAYDFVEEVLGRGAAQSVRQDKNTDLDEMPRVVDDVAGDEPRAFRTAFTARQSKRLAAARGSLAAGRAASGGSTADGATAAPVAGSGLASTASDEAARAMESTVREQADALRAGLWSRRLSDTGIVLQRTNSFDSDYSGGSSYYSSSTVLELHQGGRYRLRQTVVTRVSAGGWTAGGEPRVTVTGGQWSVEIARDQEFLRLDDDDGSRTHYRIDGSGGGAIRLDGEDRAWGTL